MKGSNAKQYWALAVVVILLLIGMTVCANPQPKNATIEKHVWEKHTKGIDYSEQYLTREISPQKNFKLPPFDFAGLGTILFVVIIAVLVFLLLRILIIKGILNSNQGKKKLKPYTLQDVEADIENADLETLLQEALQHHLYYLAIRLHFLMVLKAMYAKQLITYKKDRTNGEYLREIKYSQLFDEFKTLINLFERVWYGNFPITPSSYQVIAKQFSVFTQKIATHEK